MKKVLSFISSGLVVLSILATQIASAETFSVSGSLSTTPTTSNPYSANYAVTTSNGAIYYFDLSNPAYASAVGTNVTFTVEGTQEAYVVVSSSVTGGSDTGQGTSSSSSQTSGTDQALVKTGPGMNILLLLGALSLGIGYAFTNKGRLSLVKVRG